MLSISFLKVTEPLVKMPRTIEFRRKQIKLVDDLNYIHCKQKENSDGTKQYWMCENRTCKARVHINVDEDNYVIIKEVGEHNHATTASSVSAKCASNQIKDKALGTQDSSRTLIATELKNLHECAIAELPCPSNISRNIRRWRQKENKSPPIPQVRHGYLIPEDYAKLSTGSLFLQYDSGEDDLERILVFASADGLSDLKKFKVWAGDGTFKCCPIIYYQLYTLHIQTKDISIPRLFALLPDKTEATYKRLFSVIKDLVQNHEPDRIVVDFEKAVINSLKAVFQETEVSCCLSHLSQNVYKHTVQAGYKERYHQDDEFNENKNHTSKLRQSVFKEKKV